MKASSGFLIGIFLFFISPEIFSQILDDSTRQVYGPATTRFTTEEEVIGNSNKYLGIDTSINEIHLFDYLYNNKTLRQNLGVYGTALFEIYYTDPASIGKKSGYNSFSPYAFDPYKTKYYDTKSPYANISYMQGGSGQQLLDAEFTRNILPNWNFGMDFKRIISLKTFGRAAPRDKQADHFSFLFYTRYFTRDSIYQILSNTAFLDHKNFETGGVRTDEDDTTEDSLFDYREEFANMYRTRNFEKRGTIHFYHQLNPFKNSSLEFFHIFDFQSQSIRFKSDITIDTILYPDRPSVKITGALPGTDDRNNFHFFENKIGVKGSLSNLSYRGYYRRRDFNRKNFYDSTTVKFQENFIGGAIRFDFTEASNVDVKAEYMFAKKDTLIEKASNDFLLQGEFRNRFLFAGASFTYYSPTLLQFQYKGNTNYLQWDNYDTLKNAASTHAYLKGEIKWKSLSVVSGLDLYSISDYVYYDENAFPAQHNGVINIFNADILIKANWKSFYVRNYFRYALATPEGIINVPSVFNNFRLYFQNKIFKKAMLAQIGFDFFWKSEYAGNFYMPVTSQFYNGSTFMIQPYLLGDFFINMQLKRVCGFIKISHFNQGFWGKGYFTTPYYPAMPRNVEFGLRWMFFD